MRSSYQDLKEFEKSAIWLDMLDELVIWQITVENKLKDPDHTESLDTVRTLQGNLYAMEQFKNIVSVMKSTFDEREEKDGD